MTSNSFTLGEQVLFTDVERTGHKSLAIILSLSLNNYLIGWKDNPKPIYTLAIPVPLAWFPDVYKDHQRFRYILGTLPKYLTKIK
jgi:hypothetical protein